MSTTKNVFRKGNVRYTTYAKEDEVARGKTISNELKRAPIRLPAATDVTIRTHFVNNRYFGFIFCL